MRLFLFVIISTVFFTYSLAQPILVNVAQEVGVNHTAIMGSFQMPAQGGAAWLDYDADGWHDLYLTGGSNPDALFRNNGDGSFTETTSEAGITSMNAFATNGVTTGDVNNDGWPDVFVTTLIPHANQLLLNNGDGTFTNQVGWAGANHVSNSFSSGFADLNADGWLDLYVCNWSRNMQVTVEGENVNVDSDKNFYYENDGTGTFVEKAIQLQLEDSLGCALGVLFTDFDDDNDLDIYVANDFGYFNGNSPNRLFRNDQNGQSFTEISQLVGADLEMNGMGVAKGDIDLDGDFDFYITNMFNDKLLRNNNGQFEEILLESGMGNDSVWFQTLDMKGPKVGWGVGLLDIDNDADIDCFSVNGDLYYDYPNPCLDSNKLFVNEFGTGSFTDVSLATGVADTYVSRALAYCDYDLDGDLDVFVGITDSIGGTRKSMLYRNDSPTQSWFEVAVTGVQSNVSAIGTKTTIYANEIPFVREIGGESSFNSQHWHVAHFGLGNNQLVDSLQIEWPSGTTQSFYNLPVNQLVEVVEGQGVLITGSKEVEQPHINVYPNPASTTVSVQGDEIKTIKLLDAKGTLVLQSVAQTFGLSKLAAGNYTLEIELLDGKLVHKKMVKQ